MIIAVNFGGIHKPAPKPAPLVAPLPEEYKQEPANLTIKNPYPKPQ